MKTITWPQAEIPVVAETEVLVVGGGPAGFGAALTAARMGRKTMLKYFALCIVQMCMSGLLVSVFYRLLPYSEVTVKICIDVLLFFISFQVQKRWIFS